MMDIYVVDLVTIDGQRYALTSAVTADLGEAVAAVDNHVRTAGGDLAYGTVGLVDGHAPIGDLAAGRCEDVDHVVYGRVAVDGQVQPFDA